MCVRCVVAWLYGWLNVWAAWPALDFVIVVDGGSAGSAVTVSLAVCLLLMMIITLLMMIMTTLTMAMTMTKSITMLCILWCLILRFLFLS